MKAERIKLTSPEAFMLAFSRYNANENKTDCTDKEDEEWNQGLIIS
jgi:hypothetical protein